jgi:hypothetical protein
MDETLKEIRDVLKAFMDSKVNSSEVIISYIKNLGLLIYLAEPALQC